MMKEHEVIQSKLEALTKEFPGADAAYVADAARNPQLHDYLKYWELTELCRHLINGKIPAPWSTLMLQQIPVVAMQAAAAAMVMDKLEEINARYR